MTEKATLAPWVHAQVGGLLLGLAFAVQGAGVLAWPAVWVIVARLDQRSRWERLGDGSLSGIWWAGLTVGPWLYDASLAHIAGGAPTAALLTAGVIVFHGAVYLALFALLWPVLPAPRWLSGPAAWVLLEVLRSDAAGGAPWALLGHSQHAWLALVQLAELGGVPLVSFMVAMPALAAADRPQARWRGLVASAVVLATAVTFGWTRLAAHPGAEDGGVLVRAVSGGHLSGERLIAYLAATTDGPRSDLVVWPQTAVPGHLQDEPRDIEAVTAVARRQGPLLLGSLRHERTAAGRRYFNSALLLDEGGSLRGIYDKRRLVPFAERAPAGFPELLARPFTPGAHRASTLEAAGLRLGPLICWEGLFPALTRAWVEARADLLVNLTSDTSFGDGARQLLAYTRFRAIESRRWLLRASGTGASVVIDPAGRIAGREMVRVRPGAAPASTPYTRHPHTVAIGSVLLLAGLWAWQQVRTRGRPPG